MNRLATTRVLALRGAVQGLAGAARDARERRSLVLRVADARGGWGQGEASPLPGYSPDNIDAAAAQLARLRPADWPAPDAGDPLGWSNALLAAARLSSPAARFALETAALDWLARERGMTLARLLGAAEAVSAIRVAALVADLDAARRALAAGVLDLKIKIDGAAPAAALALALARAIRAEFGARPRLRFDANRSLAPAAALPLLQELAGLGAEFIEEPVPWSELPALGCAPIAIAADESLADPAAWPVLADCAEVLVLKPTLLGGLAVCRDWVLRARGAGRRVVFTHTFDGPIAQAATAALVAALGSDAAAPLASGLGHHAALPLWGLGGWPLIEAGWLMLPRGAGLGLADRVGPN